MQQVTFSGYYYYHYLIIEYIYVNENIWFVFEILTG